MRIYFDVCCLNRPFDDQRQERVRLETEALVIAFDRCTTGVWEWVSSEQVSLEIRQTSDRDRRERLQLAASNANEIVALTPGHFERAAQLVEWGFPPADALHIACAEAGGVDVFLTTDDQLLRRSVRHSTRLNVRVANPLQWLSEVLEP
jgi:predicted nucleic acid-binding protein